MASSASYQECLPPVGASPANDDAERKMSCGPPEGAASNGGGGGTPSEVATPNTETSVTTPVQQQTVRKVG